MVEASDRPAVPSRAEYQGRVEALRALADDYQLDATLVYGSSMRPGPLLYVTGYVPTNGFACLHLGSRGETLITDQPWDVERAADALWLCPDAIRGSESVGLDVASLSAHATRIGVVGWEILPASLVEHVRRMRPEAEFIDIGAEAAALRAVKTPAEIALIREACRITSKGAAALRREARAGRTEHELAASVESAMRAAGSGPLAFPLVLGAGPEQTASAVPLPSQRILAEGDMVLLDCGATYQGYCGDMARTLVVGQPAAETRRMLEKAYDIFRRCEETLVPRTRAAAVHALATELAQEAGYELPFLLGHGIGCQNWEPPLLGESDSTELEAGMVITLEPGLYVKGVGGVRLENTFLITPSGPEALTSGPIDLWED